MGEISRGVLELLYVLMGEDDYSRHQALGEIKKSIGDAVILPANTTVLEGQQVTLEQLRSACGTVPFLAARRLVIVEGLLGRFEPRAKYGRKKPRLPEAGEDFPIIANYLTQVPEFTALVLVDGKIGNKNPLLREIAKAHAEIKSFPWLRDAQLRQWVQQQVAASGGSIATPAVDLLVRLVGSNLWVMTNEIDKLILFAAGRRVEEADVNVVVSSAQEASVFALVDAILEFRGAVAQELLQKLLQQGASPAYLLVMLARQTRILVQVKELARQRIPAAQMQSRLGLSADFMLRRAAEQAGKYSLARLAEVYHKLLETDVAIKTGQYESELALNILAGELCQSRAAPAAAH